MPIITTQENLDLKITTTLDDDALIVDEVTIEEGIHSLFEIKIIAHSENIDLDLNGTLGEVMTVSFNFHDNKRYFSGIVARFEQLHTAPAQKNTTPIAFYQIKLMPKLWLLTHTKDFRIFQNKSVQEIIKTLLNEAEITDFSYKTKKGTTAKREYCVQYNESNFEFIARLCEEEGIFFHFEHESSLHKLIFSDSTMIATKIGGKGYSYAVKSPSGILLNQIYECVLAEQITTTDLKVIDFNYLKPSVELMSESSSDNLGGTYVDYPSLFKEANEGEPLAKSKLNALTWPSKFVKGNSTAPEFLPYKSFTLQDHPRKSLNSDYIIYKVKHKIVQARLDPATASERPSIYENEFWVFPSKTPYVPVLKHEKKRIYSYQTATVTGPSGEEIYTDEYGRIKVKFHWDFRGTEDEKSSCWIRVAQNWAGSQWGGVVIPRIGMEVVVSFMDGDPDRPLVMGCVYNGEQKPPYASKDPTKSTFKTSSSKGDDGNNELRFDDKKDHEEIYIHAQKDMNIEIEDSRTEEIIEGDDSLTIKKGSKSEKLEGKETLYEVEITDGDRKLHIKKGDHIINLDKGDQKITLKKGDQELKIDSGDNKITLTKGDMKITLSAGDLTIDVKGDVKISSVGNMKFDSKAKISMKAVGGIEINSPAQVEVKSGMNLMLKGGMNIDAAAGMNLMAKGGMNVNINGGQNIMMTSGMNLALKGGMNIAADAGVAMLLKGTLLTCMASGPAVIKGAVLKLN
ncbi:MAG: type VI secretion system tip protein VgrG [Proteobacteria bacterium]|nr:type VI secretion system tip protein VgrG [Pseudomonadota bacterium]